MTDYLKEFTKGNIRIVLLKWHQGRLQSYDVEYYIDGKRCRARSCEFTTLKDANVHYQKLVATEEKRND